jgi:hypothetical protein
MRKIFAVGVLVAALSLTGCASVDSGTIKDKVRETGRTELDCDKVGKKRVCAWETNPDQCSFQLDNGKDKGWLVVDCTTEYNAYQVGERYPR